MGYIGNIWNIKVYIDGFICEKVRSNRDFTEDFGLEGLDSRGMGWFSGAPKL